MDEEQATKEQNEPLRDHPTADGHREQERKQQDGNQKREGTCTLCSEYLREMFDKNSYESFTHAWHKAAAPDTTASLHIGLALSLSGCLTGLVILLGRIYHPDLFQALSFIMVHASCGLAVILLAESTPVKPCCNVGCEGLQEGVIWIGKWFCMSVYLWKMKRSLDNFFYKTKSKRKANKPFKDRTPAYVARSEIKTASESRLIYVKEADLSRLEYSLRSFSLAVLTIYFHIYSIKCKSRGWFSKDAQTFGTLLWCLLMTSASSTAFEQRYHEYAYIFHFYDRVYRRYSRLSRMEALLIFCTHFVRLVCKLHIIGYLLCLSPLCAGLMTAGNLIYSFFGHHLLYYSGLFYIPALLHYKTCKGFLYVEQLVSSSPVTLLCSLGTKTHSRPGTRKERDTDREAPSLLLRLKHLWKEAPDRLRIIWVKDLLPLLVSQICLSVLATHMRPLISESFPGFSANESLPHLPYNSTIMQPLPKQSRPGLSVNCTPTNAWDFRYLPDLAEPASGLRLFIPPTPWRNSAAEYVGDPMGFILLALYALCLLVYASYVMLLVNRRSGFPRAVRRSFWRKILAVKEKPDYQIRVLMVLLNLKDGERQKFLLNLLSTTAPGFYDDKLKQLFCNNWKNKDDIVKKRLDTMNFPDEGKSEEEIIRSFESSEFKDQLKNLKEQVFPLAENDEELKRQVVAFFTQPLEQRFDKVGDRDLLLMLDLFHVSIKDALSQPESRFGGQEDLYDVSQGKKYALIISNTFPRWISVESQTCCKCHIGIDPKDDSDMKRMESLLESMAFEVVCKQNVTKEQLFEALEKFRNKVRDEGGALAFIVVMSSVGLESGCGILMDDHREVGHDDIMCRFDEADELVGIPKAFLFNICVSSWKPKLSFHAGWDQKYRNLPLRNSGYKNSRRFIQDLKDTLLILPTPYFVPSRESCSASQFLTKLQRTLPPPGSYFTLMELLSRVTPAVTPYSFRDLELNPSSDTYMEEDEQAPGISRRWKQCSTERERQFVRVSDNSFLMTDFAHNLN